MPDLRIGPLLAAVALTLCASEAATVAAWAEGGRANVSCCGAHREKCEAAPVPSDLTACGQGIAGDPAAVYFAVLGDFGEGDRNCESRVAEMIDGWSHKIPLGYVLTVGDNNYELGKAQSIQRNITKYYGDLIERKVFFPTLGNHDWYTVKKAPGYKWGRPSPYLDHFSYLAQYSPTEKPKVEGRYYRVPLGKLVDVFGLDANYQEPDGTCCNSRQADWLKRELAASQAPWKLVLFHQPPYSTARDSSPGPWMRWPYKEWCASAVLSGHEHVYERLDIDGLPYIINGLGGNSWIYDIQCPPVPGSQVRYNGANGAMLAVANGKEMELCFYSVATAQPVDRIRLHPSDRVCSPATPNTCAPAADVAEYCKFQPPKKRPKESDCE